MSERLSVEVGGKKEAAEGLVSWLSMPHRSMHDARPLCHGLAGVQLLLGKRFIPAPECEENQIMEALSGVTDIYFAELRAKASVSRYSIGFPAILLSSQTRPQHLQKGVGDDRILPWRLRLSTWFIPGRSLSH